MNYIGEMVQCTRKAMGAKGIAQCYILYTPLSMSCGIKYFVGTLVSESL